MTTTTTIETSNPTISGEISIFEQMAQARRNNAKAKKGQHIDQIKAINELLGGHKIEELEVGKGFAVMAGNEKQRGLLIKVSSRIDPATRQGGQLEGRSYKAMLDATTNRILIGRYPDSPTIKPAKTWTRKPKDGTEANKPKEMKGIEIKAEEKPEAINKEATPTKANASTKNNKPKIDLTTA